MMKHILVYFLFMLVFFTFSKGQNKTALPTGDVTLKTNDIKTRPQEIMFGPNTITRNVIQDRKGNIWIATWDGVFKFDGTSFINITSDVSKARFFSILQDRKGNLWFGSIGSGVYRYDGNFFQNFTTKDGLINNDVVSMYEDKAGNIWFGAYGGASRYDGKLFHNYIMEGNSMKEDHTGETFPNERPPYEVNSIIEDRSGKLWFATRGNTFVYDSRLPEEKAFTIFMHDGKAFANVRSIIEDKKGNIWLGGKDGLWRYDGKAFTHFTYMFVGYIYEDRKGNIWTSSEKKKLGSWVLSRYDAKSLADDMAFATEIASNKKMIFGIREAKDGNIWFGSFDGVCRYDGVMVTSY